MSRRTMPTHVYREDKSVPPDQRGRPYCLCGLPYAPGDAHHTLPEPSMDARSMAAGEGGEG